MKETMLGMFIIFFVYLSNANANVNTKPCLYGHITILTKDGRIPSRKGIPISLSAGFGVDKNAGGTNTNKRGFFCIDHTLESGKEVFLNIGENPDSKTNKNWSSWRILSPYNGKINVPDNSHHSSIEVIIVPNLFYLSLLDSPPNSFLGKNCKNIHQIPHVQLMSFKKRPDAEIAKNKLVFNGFQACVATRYVKNSKWHRVLVTVGNSTALKICKKLTDNYGYQQCIINKP
jgi:hypothetical protein